MTAEQPNPLAKYFRQPAIYIKLPSKGKFWADGSLNLSESGELAVFPMTTRDELVLKTPDALLNGQGMIDVIQSCCPAIKNAWEMPSVDVDPVLIGIRIASYGETMDFGSQCPHCKHDNEHTITLGSLIETIKCPDYSQPLIYQNLKIKLRPQRYYSINSTNRINFEEQKLMNAINLNDVDPLIKAKEVSDSMIKLVEFGNQIISDSVDYIEIEDGDRITKKEYIKEFFENSDSHVSKIVQERITELSKVSAIPPININCAECTKPYQTTLTFDYSSFFG